MRIKFQSLLQSVLKVVESSSEMAIPLNYFTAVEKIDKSTVDLIK